LSAGYGTFATSSLQRLGDAKGVENFLGHSIGIDESNTCHMSTFFCIPPKL